MAKSSTPKAIKFVCVGDTCPNKDIEYNWLDATETLAECGGCGTILEAIEVTA